MKETIEVASNLRNRETHYKLRDSITQDSQKIFTKDFRLNFHKEDDDGTMFNSKYSMFALKVWSAFIE